MRKKKIKPEIVYIYNVTKAGVDKIDSTTNQYKSQRRTKKWWKAAFFYLFDFRAKQDSGSTRLSSLRKVYIKIEALLLKKYKSLFFIKRI